jgi:phage terminase small subunit
MQTFNPLHKLFILNYLIDLNATAAARRAGYSEKTARQIGSRLLAQEDIKREIQAALDFRAEKVGVKAEEVLKELTQLAFSNMNNYIDVNEDGTVRLNLAKTTLAQRGCIKELVIEEIAEGKGKAAKSCRRVRFKLYDKRQALVNLADHFKLFRPEDESRESGIINAVNELLRTIKAFGLSAGDMEQFDQIIEAEYRECDPPRALPAGTSQER